MGVPSACHKCQPITEARGGRRSRSSTTCRPREDVGPPRQREVLHEEDTRLVVSRGATVSVAGGAAADLGASTARISQLITAILKVGVVRFRNELKDNSQGCAAADILLRGHATGLSDCLLSAGRSTGQLGARRRQPQRDCSFACITGGETRWWRTERRTGLPSHCGPQSRRRPTTCTASGGTGCGATHLLSRRWMGMCGSCCRRGRAR